jgi:hypothetical protein
LSITKVADPADRVKTLCLLCLSDNQSLW